MTCPAGFYADTNSISCSECAHGKYSGPGFTACENWAYTLNMSPLIFAFGSLLFVGILTYFDFAARSLSFKNDPNPEMEALGEDEEVVLVVHDEMARNRVPLTSHQLHLADERSDRSIVHLDPLHHELRQQVSTGQSGPGQLWNVRQNVMSSRSAMNSLRRRESTVRPEDDDLQLPPPPRVEIRRPEALDGSLGRPQADDLALQMNRPIEQYGDEDDNGLDENTSERQQLERQDELVQERRRNIIDRLPYWMKQPKYWGFTAVFWMDMTMLLVSIIMIGFGFKGYRQPSQYVAEEVAPALKYLGLLFLVLLGGEFLVLYFYKKWLAEKQVPPFLAGMQWFAVLTIKLIIMLITLFWYLSDIGTKQCNLENVDFRVVGIEYDCISSTLFHGQTCDLCNGNGNVRCEDGVVKGHVECNGRRWEREDGPSHTQ